MQAMEAAFQSAGIGVSIVNRCNVASTLFVVADSSTKTCWRKSLSRYLLRGSPRTRPVFRLGTFGGMRLDGSTARGHDLLPVFHTSAG